MKKNYFIALLALLCNFAFAQIEPTTYRGAFAPAPTAMWTEGWTNFNPNAEVYPATGFNIPTVITTNTTLLSGNTYLLQGLTYVKNDATLTIQPGVVIRGATAGAGLVITRGAKINAIGTASSPIVFTSNKGVGARNAGDWGGIIILGNAAFNQTNGIAYVEGITNSTDTQYGGGTNPDNNDNSGTLKYVRIEFGGFEYAPNNEINGLTMGSVGKGTTIDYVQVSHIKDDGFEWFGGSVNCKHLVSYKTLDDDFDTANGYSGTVQFALAVRDPQAADISGSEGFEGDNTATEGTGTATPGTTALFTNCTLVGPTYRQTLTNGGTLNTNHKKAVRLRRGSKLKVFNSIFMDFLEGLHIDGLLCENHAKNGDLVFKNNILAGIKTTAKYIQTTSPATITAAGTDGAFNMTTWFTASANSNITSSANILTTPYSTDATTYTGLDYRPATNSVALTGANFDDASFNGLLVSPVASIDLIEYTTYRGAFAPAPAAMWTDTWTNYDPENTVYPATTVDVVGNITTNTTWTTGNVYKLSGTTFVKDNAILTIQPGVIIRGDARTAALVVTKGAKVNAVGTVSSPIVFTSNKAAGARVQGDWGGIILLGKGEFNQTSGVANIEGITVSADTQYGGGLTPDVNDNSGILKYVRIEFGGYEFATDKEINGLTLGAVGAGTTIDFVQVSHTKDDGFEWFGGSVNCKHLVSYKTLDDDFDTANGYSGKVQFALAVRDPQMADTSGSEGFEGDNTGTESSGTATPGTTAIFTNCTLVGPTYRQTLTNGGTLNTNHKKAVRLRRGSKLKVYNSIFMDFLEGLHIDGLLCEDHALNGDLVFKSNILAGIKTTAKYIQTTSPATITAAGTGGAFNMTTWFASTANANTNVLSSAGILTAPYNDTDALIYTGLDYRPATNSIALTGSNFSGIIAKTAPTVVTPITVCKGVAISLPSFVTLTGGTSLKWYTAATGGTGVTTAPTVATTTVTTTAKNYYVSQVYSDGTEGARAHIVVNVNGIPATPGAITGNTTALVIGTNLGTLNDFTYSIATVTDAASYFWFVPTGVNIESGQGTNSVVVNFNNVSQGAGTMGNIIAHSVNTNGCLSVAKTLSLTKALPTAPTALKMTDASLPVPTTGATAITSFAKYMGTSTVLTLTATASPQATSYVWELPTGVNVVSGATTTSGVTSGTSNVITVNFLGVTAANSLVGTANVIRIGVKAKNGTGTSVTSNSTATPQTSSFAKLLTLTAVLPAAPSAIKMINPATTVVAPALPVAVTVVSRFIGTTTVFKLTATASALASSYSWELPTGVNLVSGALTGSTSNEITVNFANVAAGTTKLYIGVKAVNGIGSSSTVNVAPNAESTAKLLTLTAAVPAKLTAITGKVTLLECGTTENYSFTASPLALKYTVTGPVDSVVKTVDNPDNTDNEVTTENTAFTVTYPTPFVITTSTPQSIVVKASNNVGDNTSNYSKVLTTKTFVGSIGTAASTTTATTPLTKFKTCQVKNLNVPTIAGSTYVWTVANGATISSGQDTNSVTISFSEVTVTSTVVTVKAVNSCGVSSTVKSITLTKDTSCTTTKMTEEKTIALVSNTEMYPNPATDIVNFNIEAISNGVVDLTIYSLDGKVVMESRGLNVENGTNSFTENVSSLNKGIYLVRITNSTSDEVITKKLIKN